MKRIHHLFTAIALAASLSAAAQQRCVLDPVSGFIVCPPSVLCVPPLVFHTMRCECPDGSPPSGVPGAPVCVEAKRCSIVIEYLETDPKAASIAVAPGCGRWPAEVGTAAALTKLLEESRQ